MKCYHCKSKNLSQLQNTKFDYEQFKCNDCGGHFNERTGTPFNRLQCRTEIVLLAIYYYVKLGNSLRQVSKMLLERGIDVSYEEVRKWVNTFSPAIINNLKKNTVKEIEKNMVR